MTWDEYLFNIVREVASKSKDRSVKVGAIITGPNHEIRSTGFNGFPRGVFDEGKDNPSMHDSIEGRHERPLKYWWTEHAERNAIYGAARVGTPLEGCTIYIDWYPCTDCARAIIQSGIIEVVIDGRDYDVKKDKWDERWKKSFECSIQMLKEAGIAIRVAFR